MSSAASICFEVQLHGKGGKLYTQADLDFFSANADEYFEMANTLRAELNRFQLLDEAGRLHRMGDLVAELDALRKATA